MLKIRHPRSSILAFLCVLVPWWLNAASYYVDFAGGADANPGSLASPFKHCPGDANATGTAAGTALHGGDAVYFKGGVSYAVSADITVPSGLLICQSTNISGGTASIDATGLLTDSTRNFSSSNIQTGDLLYVFNGSTNGAWLESCGIWGVSNVTAHTLAVSNFNGIADANPELTYVVMRPITFTTNAAFGSGPAILDGAATAFRYFIYGDYNRFSGLTFQNGYDPGAHGCTNNLNQAILYENSGSTWHGLLIDNCLFTNIWSTFAIDRDLIWSVFQNNTCQNYGQFGCLGGQFPLTQNNYFTNGTGGCNSSGAYSVIRFNTIVHMNDHCGYHADCIGPMFSTSANPGGNVYGWIYGNWCEDATQGIFLTYNNGGTYGWTVANNVLVGLRGESGTGPGGVAINMDSCPQARIWNNVMIGTNAAFGWINGLILGENDPIGTNATGVSFKNNILYSGSLTTPMGAVHIYTSAFSGFVSEGNYNYQPNFGGSTIYATDDNHGNQTNLTFAQWQAVGYDNAGHSANGVNPNFVQPNGVYPAGFDLRLTAPIGGWYGLPVAQNDFGKTLMAANALRLIGVYGAVASTPWTGGIFFK